MESPGICRVQAFSAICKWQEGKEGRNMALCMSPLGGRDVMHIARLYHRADQAAQALLGLRSNKFM